MADKHTQRTSNDQQRARHDTTEQHAYERRDRERERHLVERYFVLRIIGYDGFKMNILTRDELIEALRPSENPDRPGMRGFEDAEILEDVQGTENQVDGVLIIKGTIIVPRVKTRVTEYEIP